MFFRLSATYIKRCCRSPLFLLAVVGYFALMFFTVFADFRISSTENGIYYFLKLAYISNSSTFLMMIACVPASSSFCEDYSNKSLNNIVVRSGKAAYSYSVITSSAVVSSLVVLIGELLFLAVIATKYPFVGSPGSVYINFLDTTADAYLFDQGYVFAFYAIHTLRKMALAAMFAALSTAFSFIFTNKYLTYVFPFILFTFISLLTLKFGLPYLFDPDHIFGERKWNAMLLGSDILGTLYPFIFSLIICVFCSWIAQALVKRKL
jgi:hypothetical protein